MTKQLKASTIKNYSLAQIVNHAESFMIQHDTMNFRFSNCGHQYVMVFEYDANSNSYSFAGNYDKADFVDEVLSSIYRASK